MAATLARRLSFVERFLTLFIMPNTRCSWGLGDGVWGMGQGPSAPALPPKIFTATSTAPPGPSFP